MKNSVRIERAILQITQEELAKKVGVTRQTIHALENGKYVPSTVLALKISAICGKPLDEIFQLETEDWTD